MKNLDKMIFNPSGVKKLIFSCKYSPTPSSVKFAKDLFEI